MEVKSPGGFVFGIQGYEYGEVRPKSITFFVDGTARVGDHRGNPIQVYAGSHKEVIVKLEDAGVDWQKLDWAGWPQLEYSELKELGVTLVTPLDELVKIKDKELRTNAIKFRRELDAAKIEEVEVEV